MLFCDSKFVFFNNYLTKKEEVYMAEDTMQCLIKVAKIVNKSFELREKMRKLLGVEAKAGRLWFVRHNLPKGLNLLKLRFFLEFFGYKPQELENLPLVIYNFAQVVAFEIIDAENAAILVGFKEDQPTSDLLRILLARGGTTKAKAEKMKLIYEENRLKVQEKRDEWINAIGCKTAKPSEITVAQKATLEAKSLSLNKEMPQVLANLILAAVPLAKALLSDDFSPEHRRQLRDLTKDNSTNGVFELSNLLNRLCSEKARELL